MKLCLGGRCFLKRSCRDVEAMITQGDLMTLRIKTRGGDRMMSLHCRADEVVARHVNRWFQFAVSSKLEADGG